MTHNLLSFSAAGDCTSNPCMNGATCSNDTDGEGYNCTCASGYTGDMCETGRFAPVCNTPHQSTNLTTWRRVLSVLCNSSAQTFETSTFETWDSQQRTNDEVAHSRWDTWEIRLIKYHTSLPLVKLLLKLTHNSLMFCVRANINDCANVTCINGNTLANNYNMAVTYVVGGWVGGWVRPSVSPTYHRCYWKFLIR